MHHLQLSLLAMLVSLTVACSGAQKSPQPAPGDGDAPAGNNGTEPTQPGGDTSVSSPTGDVEDGCSREIAIKCRAPFVDGCMVQHPTDAGRKLTTEHRCVSSEPSSTPCEAEIALECGDAAQDACLLDPPAGDVHFCVAI